MFRRCILFPGKGYLKFYVAIFTLSFLLYAICWTDYIMEVIQGRMQGQLCPPVDCNNALHLTTTLFAPMPAPRSSGDPSQLVGMRVIRHAPEAIRLRLVGYQGGNGSYCSGREPIIPTTQEELPQDTAPDVPISFPVDEPYFCSDNPELEVIAYVLSTLTAIGSRNKTRHTWGSAYKHGIRMRVVFMVGRPKNVIEERVLYTERNFYHDIIQGNFTEEYHLVTYKVLSSLYWVSSRCPSVPWVIRADDDVLVDPFLLHKLLPCAHKEGFNCYLWPHSEVKRTGVWAMTKQQWNDDFYPPFCAGAFVFHHHQLLHRILEASCRTPLKVWMEDVYVFGLLAGQAGGIKPEFKVMKHSHRGDKIKEKDLGKIISWVETNDRTFWWEKIENFHKVYE